mgnify:FL=1
MALQPNSPIYTPFTAFINGLAMAYTSTTSITIAAGNASDSTVINEIILAAPAVISTAANGLNGLDTGTIANNTHYAVYVVADSTEKYPAGAMLSLASNAAPYLPFGYDMFRRVGYVLTNGSAEILEFTQRKNGVNRDLWYANAIATNITAGASATFAAVTASASVPAGAKEVFIKAVLTADAGATRTAALRAHSSTSTLGQVFMSSPASTVTTASLLCPCDASGAIDYVVSNAAAAIALSVSGYVDALV